jgi:predicted N-formylglutamate amidohydrolase
MPAPGPRVISCEHGGNDVPELYRKLFDGRVELLASHRGWDAGSLHLADALGRSWDVPVTAATVTRLLVDLNRSPGHPRVFSDTTRALPRSAREELIECYHRPHRDAVRVRVAAAIAADGMAVHIGVHSFTPVLAGVERRADLALLYDPARPRERATCLSWAKTLAERLPDLRIRRNQPYRGACDGLTTTLRREFPPDAYMGIEIEVNQRLLEGAHFPERVVRALAETLGHLPSSTGALSLPPP